MKKKILLAAASFSVAFLRSPDAAECSWLDAEQVIAGGVRIVEIE